MSYSKMEKKDAFDGLKEKTNKWIDHMQEQYRRATERVRVRPALIELQGDFSDILLDAMGAGNQSDNPETPLFPPDLKQEIRRRVHCSGGSPGGEDPWDSEAWDSAEEDEGPAEDERSFCQRLWRSFRAMMSRLACWLRAAWAWLREKAVALARAVGRAVAATWQMLCQFCSYVQQQLFPESAQGFLPLVHSALQ